MNLHSILHRRAIPAARCGASEPLANEKLERLVTAREAAQLASAKRLISGR